MLCDSIDQKYKVPHGTAISHELARQKLISNSSSEEVDLHLS